MTKFEIKYLFELYPDVDFSEDFITQDVIEGKSVYESVATSDKWEHIFDNAAKRRTIQTVKKTEYTILFTLGRNIDIARMTVGDTTVTLTDGTTFTAHDIDLKQEEIAGTSTYKITLTFYKYEDNLINHLSHKNARVVNYYDIGKWSLSSTSSDFKMATDSYLESILTVGKYYDYIMLGPDADTFESTENHPGLKYNGTLYGGTVMQFIFDSLSTGYSLMHIKLATDINFVNIIKYKIDNAPFTFNNVSVYSEDDGKGNCDLKFDIPIDNLTDNLSVGDLFYMHSDNTTFNAVRDNTSYSLFAKVESKSSTTLVFVCNETVFASDPGSFHVNNIVIDNVPSYPDISNPSSISLPSVEFNICTLLQPKKTINITEHEGVKLNNDIEENQSVNSNYQIDLKAFLTNENIYLAEYLNYALFDDITVYLEDGTTIKPNKVRNIITKKENNNLVNLHEFDISVIYNNKKVNIFR